MRNHGGGILWVDIAKGLGLVLVFWGHILYGGSGIASRINHLIYSFHMPMYFILSGYVLRPDDKSPQEYARLKFTRILLPALLFYIATMPIYFTKILHDGQYSLYDVVMTVFYVRGECAYNDPIWFFISMYTVLLSSKIIRLASMNATSKLKFSFAVFIIAVMLHHYHIRWFSLFGLDKALLGLGFYSFGAYMRTAGFIPEKINIPICVLLFIGWFGFGYILNPKISMYAFVSGGNMIYFILSGCMGSLLFFKIASKLTMIPAAYRLAKSTTIVVCSHYIFVTSFGIMAGVTGITGTYLFDMSSFIYVLIILSLYIPICRYINQHIPILNGNRR